MAKKKRFRLELGWPGLIFSLGLLICLFLWVFVLGFYFGQKVVGSRVKKMASPASKEALTAKKEKVSPPPPVFEEVKPPPLVGEPQEKVATPKPEPMAPKRPQTAPERPKTAKPAEPARPKKGETARPKITPKKSPKKQVFYTVQVASLRSAQEAEKFVRYLREKGYEAFVRRVTLPQKGTWYRVYVGRFPTISQARSFGEKLKQKEKFKAFYIQRLSER